MKLITRTTDYAIRAIMYIATSENDIVSTAELNRKLNLPRPFMRKLFPILQKKGILRSIKGNKGGFMLTRSPREIYITDLMRVFQGEITITNCSLKQKGCSKINKCSIRSKVKDIEEIILSELEPVTIASLLKGA